MCGIAGILANGEGGEEAVARMTRAMHHRGPDDHGLGTRAAGVARISLGNTRLAIIDLSSAGHMPMDDPASGNWITYNGEIYNFRELRRELEAQGEAFRSGTDTEVILAAYRNWGRDCLERFEGMFALGLWDAGRRELFLARDRAGKKPLYTFQLPGGGFLFASEVRALLASGLVPKALDPIGLDVYLFNGFLVAPATLVRGVRSLMPGSWMTVGDDGRIRDEKKYWRLPAPSYGPGPLEKRIEEARDRLAEAVTKRLVSDVPLGAFLSGGLDSSATVALMTRSGGDVRTFSVAFEEPRFDESPYSRWVAERFHTVHREVRLGREQFLAWLDDALGAMDQPTYDGVNSYCVSRVARENGLTVALSGAGGDEIFGGYPFFRTARWVAGMVAARRRLGLSLRRPVERLFAGEPRGASGWRKTLEAVHMEADDAPGRSPGLVGYQISQMLFPAWIRGSLLAAPDGKAEIEAGLPTDYAAFLDEEMAAARGVDKVSVAAWRLFLAERCLRDIDTMSMGVSLEVRAPLVDHLFLASVFEIPGRVRCRGVPHKEFEHEFLRPILGDDYPYRRKQGFLLPFEEWMQARDYQERVMGVLADAGSVRRAGLAPEAVQGVARAYAQPGAGVPWSRLWSLFVLVSWCARNEVRGG